jgi:drug/metabolite transporter (DMT)-like permease
MVDDFRRSFLGSRDLPSNPFPRGPLGSRVSASPWSWRLRGLVLLLSVLWGFNFVFIKVGLADAGALWLALLRAGVGAGSTAALVYAFGAHGRLDGKARRDALLIGIPSTTGFYALLFSGLDAVLPGFASVLVYSFPLWVAILSPWALGHPLTRRLGGALAVGFAGVILVSQPWGDFGGRISTVPVVELLAGAFSWALGTVLFQRRFPREQMVEANVYQLLGGTAGLAVVVAILAPSPLPAWTPGLFAVLLWIGVAGTAIAYTVWSYLLGHTRAVTISAYLFLVPVVTLIASAAIFHELLDPVQLLGVGLVLVSIYGIGSAPGAHNIHPAQSGSG